MSVTARIAKPNLRAWNSICQVVAGTLVLEPLSNISQSMHKQEATFEVDQLSLKLSTVIWDAGVPSRNVSAVPSTHPVDISFLGDHLSVQYFTSS